MMLLKFSSLPRKESHANHGKKSQMYSFTFTRIMHMMLIIEKKNNKRIPFLLPEQFLDNLNHLLNTDTKDIANFLV